MPATCLHLHLASPIIAFGNVPGEIEILNWVVLNHDRELLLSGIERWTLGNCPRLENTADCESEVVMEVRRMMLMDDKPPLVLAG